MNYHDATTERARAIIIVDRKILLIHRIKKRCFLLGLPQGQS